MHGDFMAYVQDLEIQDPEHMIERVQMVLGYLKDIPAPSEYDQNIIDLCHVWLEIVTDGTSCKPVSPVTGLRWYGDDMPYHVLCHFQVNYPGSNFDHYDAIHSDETLLNQEYCCVCGNEIDHLIAPETEEDGVMAILFQTESQQGSQEYTDAEGTVYYYQWVECDGYPCDQCGRYLTAGHYTSDCGAFCEHHFDVKED